MHIRDYYSRNIYQVLWLLFNTGNIAIALPFRSLIKSVLLFGLSIDLKVN